MFRVSWLLLCILISGLLAAGCSQQTSSTSPEAQLALDYISIFQNGTDLEAKKKFVEEKAHPESKPLFLMAASVKPDPATSLSDPQVLETITYKDKDKEGSAVLVRGKTSTNESVEEIFLIVDGKLLWGFSSNAKDEKTKKSFEQIRSQFKAESPK